MEPSLATPESLPPARRSWRRWLAGALLALATAATIYLGYSLWFGGAIGALCDTASDCAWSGLGHRVCLQTYWGYCTKPCRTDANCPPAFLCAADNPNRRGPLCLRRPPARARR
jgi:hypothetical protein